ncbi:MAG: ABC transporter permease [Anaerolineae bacterium]|jgi:rhamnose transport system permease protein|nr:ABC transporter permease [Anaerolineae bacterium]
MSANQAAMPAAGESFLSVAWRRLKSWEGLLLVMLLLILVINSTLAPGYLTINNQINLFILSIEKIMIALVMTFLIINGEIDLSAPSIMGLAACVSAFLFSRGTNFATALVIALCVGLACGIFNGFWIARVGLNSLVVTLATQISYRGLARVFVEDKSIGKFPEWFNRLGQQDLIGPFPFALLLFFFLFAVALVILQYSGFGRQVYVIGNSKDVARFSGVKVPRVKFMLYVASGLMAALAGLLLAARFGAVRGDLAAGYELDIITMVLLGGVSIFGGSGTLYGVFLSIMIILNVRNGMGLAGLSGHFQTGVIGVLLIFSVLGPNMINRARAGVSRRRMQAELRKRAT